MSSSEAQGLQQATTLASPKAQAKEIVSDLAPIKRFIWIYFLLLLFEGAFRKWFLPGWSQELLIIRDPIALWIYYLAYSRGIFPLHNPYINKALQWTILPVHLVDHRGPVARYLPPKQSDKHRFPTHPQTPTIS